MEKFSIEKFKKHPEWKLILRHYREDQPEVWPIEETPVLVGNNLIIKVPETGYYTKPYAVINNEDCEVRDEDENLVGAVEFDTGLRICFRNC
jgi:hypothetical protein